MRIALCNEVLAALPLERQCELAATLGYDGLEIAPFTLGDAPHRLPAAQIARVRRTVEDAGLVVTGLHWLLVKPEGLSVTSPDPALREQTLDVMERLVDLCAALGGRVLVHGSPKQRAIFEGSTHADASGRLRDGLFRAAEAAGRAGVTYCLEPLARRETPLVNTLAEAAAMVRDIGHPSLKTMIDCSAAGQAEAEPVEGLVRRWMPTGLVGHIHLNDPNREGPGQGEMRFAPILRALRDTNYAFGIGVEPFDYRPDGAGVAAYSAGYIKGLLEALTFGP